MACSWIGVGCSYPRCWSASSSGSDSPSSANVAISEVRLSSGEIVTCVTQASRWPWDNRAVAFDEAEILREFIREITLRIERALDKFGADLRGETSAIRGETSAIRDETRAIRDEMSEQRKESRRYFEALYAKMEYQEEQTRELREESRAQTQALLRMIDRLDNGGAAAAG